MKLLENPFYVLKCLPESNKNAILEQADKLSLEIDEQICVEAKNNLLNPNRRLEAEICWFLGLDAKTIAKRFNKIFTNMQEYISEFIFEKTNYHLAESNLLSFGLEITNEPNYWTYDNIILAANYLCSTSEKIKTDDVKNLIIQTRDISKFPTNISEEEINFLIEKQKKYYRNSLFNFLKKVELNQLISILTKLVNEATDNGQYTCKWTLLEDLIFDYEISFKTIFQKRDSDIKNYIQYIIDNILPLKLPDNSLNDSFYELEKKIDVWNEAVQPIKILKKSRGIDDDYFYSIFESIRNLGIKASNDYDYFIFSYRLTKLLSVKFSEIRKIYEIIKNDEFNLENLINLKTEQKN